MMISGGRSVVGYRVRGQGTALDPIKVVFGIGDTNGTITDGDVHDQLPSSVVMGFEGEVRGTSTVSYSLKGALPTMSRSDLVEAFFDLARHFDWQVRYIR